MNFNTFQKISAVSQRGFTVAELVVAVALFSIVIALGTGVFVAVIRGQQNAEENQNVADNARSAIEIMSRAIRVSHVCDNGNLSTCPAISRPLPCAMSGNGTNSCLTILHALEGLITYAYDPIAKKITVQRGALGSAVDFTSTNNVDVERLDFIVSDAGFEGAGPPYLASQEQPRVTVIMQVRGKRILTGGAKAALNLQTTITPRDVELP